jgi:hypothetical protein
VDLRQAVVLLSWSAGAVWAYFEAKDGEGETKEFKSNIHP